MNEQQAQTMIDLATAQSMYTQDAITTAHQALSVAQATFLLGLAVMVCLYLLLPVITGLLRPRGD